MYKIIRMVTPDLLNEKAEEWTGDLLEKRKTNPSYFIWHEYHGEKVNHILQKPLLDMTKEHCAYCDTFFESSPVTIDHFQPKSKFPELAFTWSNLFPCCGLCQQRLDTFSDLLLKPDEANYNFERYFYFDVDNFKIIPNPAASNKDQERARVTIDLFQLDVKARRRGIEIAFQAYKSGEDIDTYPYRYFIQSVVV